MSNLERRIEKLEQAVHGGGCEVCRDWPPTKVAYTNDWRDRPNRPEIPDACPRCGWEPYRITITYVDRWIGSHLGPGRVTVLPASDTPPAPRSLAGLFGPDREP